MSNKRSVYFGQPLMRLLEGLEPGDTVSGRINQMVERYHSILERHGIDLDEGERVVLGNVLSGSYVDPLLIRHLADEVEDSEFEASDLVDKLRKATYADLVATVDKLGF